MSQRTLHRREILTLKDTRRAAALAEQNRQVEIANHGGRPLVGPLPGSPFDQPHLDLSECPLAKAYPHWDHYVEETTEQGR